MHYFDLRTQFLRVLLNADSEVLTRKSAAAASVTVLADVIGQLCSLILRENGEATLKVCIEDIVKRIETGAQRSYSGTPERSKSCN